MEVSMRRVLSVVAALAVVAVLSAAPAAAADRWWFGGGLGLSFGGDVKYLEVEPLVGYQVTDNTTVGGGLIYRQREDERFEPTFSTHDYGASVFVRYHVIPRMFLQGEYEYLSYEFRQFDGSTDRDDFGSVLGGLGYSQPIGPRSGFFASMLYNFSYDSDERSPYDSPWVVRFGIGVRF
jgi:hypothetical protein